MVPFTPPPPVLPAFHPAVLCVLPVLSFGSLSHSDTGALAGPLCLPVALPSSFSVLLACLLSRTVLYAVTSKPDDRKHGLCGPLVQACPVAGSSSPSLILEFLTLHWFPKISTRNSS